MSCDLLRQRRDVSTKCLGIRWTLLRLWDKLGHCIDGLCLGQLGMEISHWLPWKRAGFCFHLFVASLWVDFPSGSVLKTQGFFKSRGQERVVVSLSKPLWTADPMQRCFPGKALMLQRVVICSLRRRQPKQVAPLLLWSWFYFFFSFFIKCLLVSGVCLTLLWIPQESSMSPTHKVTYDQPRRTELTVPWANAWTLAPLSPPNRSTIAVSWCRNAISGW